MRAFRATGALIDYVEEPLAGGGLLPAAPLPQALDETLVGATPDAATAWLRRDPAFVVLKPMLLGLLHTWRLMRAARTAGVRAIVSASFETGLGLHAAAALAAGTNEVAGLGTAGWFAADLVHQPDPAVIDLAGDPVTPDPSRLELIHDFA